MPFFSAHNAVVTCSVFAPNPNRILDQILRNTTGLRSEEAELEEVDAEDTRSEPAVEKAGARSKHSKAKQPQHHVRAIFTCLLAFFWVYVPKDLSPLWPYEIRLNYF